MFNETDYRNILKEKLEDRMRVNPSYSMRALARDLEIPATRLSQVLQGKQGISEEVAERMALKMSFSETEADFFCTLVKANDARSKTDRKIAQLKLATQFSPHASQRLELDTFKMMSDWHHQALLELTTTKGFKNDTLWIAKRLGISKEEAQGAAERLKRLNLLKEQGKTLVQTHHNLEIPSEIPNDGIKKFHGQLLQKAMQAIHSQTVEERSVTSLVVALRLKDIPAFKEQIMAFLKAFNQNAESREKNKAPEEVYSLGVQLIRLTKKESDL